MKTDDISNLLAKWRLGDIKSEELPTQAVELLVAGYDSPSLREPTMRSCRPLFEAAVEELGWQLPEETAARLIIAKHYALQIVEGTISPAEGAGGIWVYAYTRPSSDVIDEIVNRYYEYDAYDDCYTHDDRADQIAELDRDIVAIAQRIVDLPAG